ncbi:MAG: ATP-binding protein [Candidatus Rokuibacteriota bacterium]
MTLHKLLPLIAFLLNVSLAGIALFRNPGSRLNRVFAYFVGGLAVWNFGVFMLRRSGDEPTAYFWEVLIHVGIIPLPALYYHFILIFLDATVLHRRSLVLAYTLSLLFIVINLSQSDLFMTGVTGTYWGWAPATGPLYMPFFVFFNAFLIYGISLLVGAYRAIDSSFRRNRARLVLLGSFVSLAGGFVDFVRFILARVHPPADLIYPVGIPANMFFALTLGTSIVRYRMFDVDVVVKKAAVYSGVGVVLMSVLAVVTQTLERYFDPETHSVVWVAVPLGIAMTLLLGFGQRLEGRIERLMFSRRQGCYETLLALSKRMSAILNVDRLVDTLVQGLVQGVPLSHCVLMTHDPQTNAFVPYRTEQAFDAPLRVKPLPTDSPVVRWLVMEEGVLVKEEAKLNPRLAGYFETSEAELEEITAPLIVPLKIENKLIAILLVGEKLSGEIFDQQELEVLSLLANQAAVALENARLYEDLGTSNAQLVQASRLKSQFLASMSHELRTPLNSIIGFSKVLLNRLDGELNDKQEAYVRSVHNSSTHLLQLINSILDISRIEAGKLDLKREPFDLLELVDECMESSAPLARGKPLKVERDVPVDMLRVTADRTKVKQVLLNLLSNAIKFTPGGRVVVRARPEAEAVHVSVSDTGVGIRKADLGRLFEPFERLENPLARHAGGTGLGLAISKKFVELHGGQMWAESRENLGSTFHFTLPLAPAPAAAEAL